MKRAIFLIGFFAGPAMAQQEQPYRIDANGAATG
jgi:hypothetical protein